jgi:peptidoglycan pentaglycine glycine transferase (the first glycine)
MNNQNVLTHGRADDRSVESTTYKLEMPADISSQDWNSLISGLPGAHVLQTAEWGQVKSQYGWTNHAILWRDEAGGCVGAALALFRRASIPFLNRLGVLYIPKGPLFDWSDIPLRRCVLRDIETLAGKLGAIFVKIDPDVRLGMGITDREDAIIDSDGEVVCADLNQAGWRFSEEQVQFRNTVLVDLTPNVDQLLSTMKQKTRYNIHLAQRKGVTVRTGNFNDLPVLFKIYAETAQRDGFVIRDFEYYERVWTSFIRAGMAEALIAEVTGVPVAGLILFWFAGKAWFLYGMSRGEHRDKMPNYLLQWEAMQRAKAYGCRVYDLWGAPDEFRETDPMWGVYRFKEGFNGIVERHIGAWDLPVKPQFYRLYVQFLPRLLDMMRWRGRKRTQRLLS